MNRFLYRATGRREDLHDNLRAEVDRLQALAELLGCAGDRLDPGRVGGVAELLRDVADRLSEMLSAGAPAPTGGCSARRRR